MEGFRAIALCGLSVLAGVQAGRGEAQTAPTPPAGTVAPTPRAGTAEPIMPAPRTTPGTPNPPGPLLTVPDTTNIVQKPDEVANTADIIVTGVRASLEKAATIKRDAVQVVDSIVANDIGKFPDPTVAAALQRVPGVQVQVNSNNELANVRIRGLPDILTTVDGREVFSTTDRTFNLNDLPAEALARVDVLKSQTADLIEGGVAGAIDLKLNKPFSFKRPTVVLSARNYYAVRADASNPQFGLLATDRFPTGIGEFGVLVNATYQLSHVAHSQSNLTDRRSSNTTPFFQPGYLIPEVFQNQVDVGQIERKQVNAALQWQITPAFQAYVDGLYANTYNTVGFVGFNAQPFNTNVRLSDVVATDQCFAARVNATGQNPNIVNNANGTRSLQPYTVQNLCNIKSATFGNIVVNQNSNSQIFDTDNKLIAGGFRFDRERVNANIDIGYQTSRTTNQNVNTTVGQRVSSVQLLTNDDGGMRLSVPGGAVLNSANLSIRNQLNQNFSDQRGSLLQARGDVSYKPGGFLPKIQAGFRVAKREADLQAVQQSTANPYGNVGTATEARARLVSTLPLGPNFFSIVAYGPRINDGSDFLGIDPAFLRSESGRAQIRRVFGAAAGRPAYDPTRQFDADEKTYSGYVQASYEVPISGPISIDGVVGARVTKTDRTIGTFTLANGAPVPSTAKTSDTDVLPNATARLKLPDGFQLRASYAKTIRRPDFTALNPSLSLVVQNNPLLLNTGSAGNPDLRPQKADSYDGTVEYYFPNGYVAIAGYYRTIANRVITASSQETINGLNFLISRPRNVGKVNLKGVEASGQYFFKFLPGAFAGLGVTGAFTLADSKVTQPGDPLDGYPLLGVSKYNYTAGLVYDFHGFTGRLVYTYRSRYYNADITGQTTLRPYDASRPVTDVYLPTFLNYYRPAGRLDFSVGADITRQFRIDVGGTNVIRTQTKSYNGLTYLNNSVFGDETTYTIGVRVQF